MLTSKANFKNQVCPIHHGNETWLHGHPMRIFDSGGKAKHFNPISTDVSYKISKVGERSHNADLGRVSWFDKRKPYNDS
jgi:hypothetical protein